MLSIFVAGTALTLTGAALAQQDRAAAEAPAGSAIDEDVLHAQVLLDRAGFAPGVIDGKKGMSFGEAVEGFQTSRGLPVTGELDDATRAALLQSRVPATLRLRIDESDARGPFATAGIPDEPEEQARLKQLGYRNLLEKLAEKFHTTPATILALNDPQTLMRAGSVLRLPNVLPTSRAYGDLKDDQAQMLSDLNVSGGLPKADRIVVDKSDGVLRLFREDRLVAQFPATMGSTHDPLPLGQWKVTTVAYNPPFHYQPDLFWDVADDEEEHRLPPGPNGPVGTVWIDLTKEHYGIHGTAEPQTIQRAQSHGCVRLTNWDAARVATMVEDGMTVLFQA